MNLLTQFRMSIQPLVIAFVLAFALAPVGTQAGSPRAETPDPPPGGYPGNNTAAGEMALYSLLGYPGYPKEITLGVCNTGLGAASLFSVIEGSYNTSVGHKSLVSNTSDSNTGVGCSALMNNTVGFSNTATGRSALTNNTFGNFNVASGQDAMFLNTTGGGNTAMGYGALQSNTTGVMNIALGYYAGWNVSTAYNVISIGSLGGNVNNSTWINNVYGVTTQSGVTAPVVVSNTGQLGTVASSQRFKKDIATMDSASDAILSLRPVTFHYKSDTGETPQFGLIAEEVAKVNSALVLPDKDGKPYTVRYDAVNAMLLNEFLKEHRTVQELKKEVAALTATAKEQASQIQKVTAQLEMIRPAPRTVLNK